MESRERCAVDTREVRNHGSALSSGGAGGRSPKRRRPVGQHGSNRTYRDRPKLRGGRRPTSGLDPGWPGDQPRSRQPSLIPRSLVRSQPGPLFPSPLAFRSGVASLGTPFTPEPGAALPPCRERRRGRCDSPCSSPASLSVRVCGLRPRVVADRASRARHVGRGGELGRHSKLVRFTRLPVDATKEGLAGEPWASPAPFQRSLVRSQPGPFFLARFAFRSGVASLGTPFTMTGPLRSRHVGSAGSRCVSRCPRPLAPARVLRPTWLARHTAVKCRRGVERAAARHPRAAAGCRSDAHHRPDASRPLSDRSRHRRTRAGVRPRDARARATARSRARRRAAATAVRGDPLHVAARIQGQHAADRPALSGARDRDDSPWPSSPTPQSTISPGARRSCSAPSSRPRTRSPRRSSPAASASHDAW